MAGLGKKTFTAGEVLTAADVNGYLMEQSVMVFGGTAARSSAIPTPSEGMVTYRSDADALEYYNGSAWTSVAPVENSGLTLLNTTTFTTQASVAIDNVFTTTYDNYKIIINLTAFAGTSETDLLIYLRANGSDTTTNYVSERLYQSSTTVGGNRVSTGRVGFMSTTYPSFTTSDITIYNPKKTSYTVWTSLGFYIQNNGVPNQALTSGYQDTTTSFDGIKIFPNAGTSISGTIRIYGIRNS